MNSTYKVHEHQLEEIDKVLDVLQLAWRITNEDADCLVSPGVIASTIWVAHQSISEVIYAVREQGNKRDMA